MSLAPGAQLGAYRIISVLGSGGMGEVYRAHDARLGREVAIKILPDAMAKDPDGLARFEREARAVAALNHPHIVTIYTTEEAGGVRFLTMELIEGRTLDQIIPDGGLPLTQFFEIAVALADALHAAHQKHITHRDLKPSNVMVTDDGRVKVLDFGLASAGGPAGLEAGADITRPALTQAGTILGTMPYMSPEQIEGKPIDQRSDLFSLGVVLYEMATGRRPFSGDSSPALMSSILRDHPEGMNERRPDLPEGAGRLIARCLEKSPRDRVQSAHDVLADIRAVRRAWESGVLPPPKAGRTSARDQLKPGDFRIAVLPFVSRSTGDAEALADGLTDDITAGLSRFQHLRVVARHDAEQGKGRSADARTAETVGARYLLDGTVRTAGAAVRVSARLVDSATGAHVWADTYERALGGGSPFELQDDVVGRIVATVADSAGVLVRSMAAALKERAVDELSVADLVLRFHAFASHFRADEHLKLRAGLERALTAEPHHAVGWACLSSLYEEEYSHGLNALPDPLSRSAEAAERSVEIDPACQLGWLAIAALRFFDRDLNGLRMAAERTIPINPLNSTPVAFLGLMLSYAGEWDRGVPMVAGAMDRNPHHPGWYRYVLATNHYRQGEYEDARLQAKQSNMPQHLWSPLMLAVSAGQLGHAADARSAFDALRRNHPAFLDPQAVRTLWSLWMWDENLVDHLLNGFAKAVALDESKSGGPGAVTPASGLAPAGGRSPSIAVLPFTDMSAAKDQDWFCDGIAEEILNALAQLDGLKVAARASAFSFRDSKEDLAAIGEKLHVTTVLDGSVRRAGDRVRITARLSNVQDGYQLWSERYDREMKDIFDVQDEIAKAIAERLRVTLSGEADARLVPKATANVEAYQVYLQGRALLYKRGKSVPLALEQFQKAVAIDPNYALAWAGIADVFTVFGYFGAGRPSNIRPLAIDAAHRAIALDPDSAESHTALAGALLFYQRDLAGAEREFVRAIELSPHYIQCRTWYAVFYLAWTRGRFDEALAQARHAVALDPLSSYTLSVLALVLGTTRLDEEAIATGRRATEIDPDSMIAHFALGEALLWAGRPDEAVASHREACRVSAQSSFATTALAFALGAAGRTDDAGDLLRQLEARARSEYVAPCQLAIVALAAGDHERALALAQEAWEARDPFLLAVGRHNPNFRWFLEQPAFQKILREMDAGRPL